MAPYWLALDVGTHAVKAAVVGRDGAIGSLAEETIALIRHDERRVEQDPTAIAQALKNVIERATAAAPGALAGAGLACQRSTVVAWRRDNGLPLGPALSWQDTRGHQQVADLASVSHSVRERSGLVLSAYYGASKLRWLQERHGVDRANLCLSPLVSFLLHHLLRERPCICDESNAGRTQLWHWRDRRWDAELLRLFGVKEEFLPQVKPTLADYGQLHSGVPLQAVAGDQNAALAAVLDPAADGDAMLANLGSGAFVLTFAAPGTGAPEGLLQGLAYSDAAVVQSIWEGTVNGAGLALSWFAAAPEVQAQGGEPWLLSQLPHWLADTACVPPVFLNAVGGLGSPFWRAGLESRFDPPGAPLAARAVAVVESIVFLLSHNLDALRRAKPQLQRIVLTGGLARLDGLSQRLADLQQLPVTRLAQAEATLLGCARLAAGFRLPSAAAVDEVFQPRHNPGLRQRLERFIALVNTEAAKPDQPRTKA